MAKDKANTFKTKVKFQSLNFGKSTARLGVKINRDGLDSERICHFLCDARLQVTLKVTDGQKPLIADALPHLNSVVDSKRVSLGADDATAGLTFSLNDVDTKNLCGFAQKEGELVAERIGSIADDAADE